MGRRGARKGEREGGREGRRGRGGGRGREGRRGRGGGREREGGGENEVLLIGTLNGILLVYSDLLYPYAVTLRLAVLSEVELL